VDYEYCLRAVTAGWVILHCEDAVLSHVPGNSRRHSLFGFYLGTTANYNPIRHYYLMRNGMWVLRRYWKRHSLWCAKQALLILKELTKVFIFEENRRAKFGFAVQGLTDARQGKLGKLDISIDEERPNH
jgi:rhamnosyltransferase